MKFGKIIIFLKDIVISYSKKLLFVYVNYLVIKVMFVVVNEMVFFLIFVDIIVEIEEIECDEIDKNEMYIN